MMDDNWKRIIKLQQRVDTHRQDMLLMVKAVTKLTAFVDKIESRVADIERAFRKART